MRNFIDDYFDQNHKTLDLNRKGSAYVISLKTTDKSRNSSQIFGETSIIHIGGKYLTRVSLSYNLQNISKETCNKKIRELEETITSLKGLGFRIKNQSNNSLENKTDFEPSQLDSKNIMNLIEIMANLN